MFSGIQNYYEQLVFRRIQEVEPSQDEAYLEDIACLALNVLPCKYIRFSVDLASHMSAQEQAAMNREVASAVEQAIGAAQKRLSQRD